MGENTEAVQTRHSRVRRHHAVSSRPREHGVSGAAAADFYKTRPNIHLEARIKGLERGAPN